MTVHDGKCVCAGCCYEVVTLQSAQNKRPEVSWC